MESEKVNLKPSHVFETEQTLLIEPEVELQAAQKFELELMEESEINKQLDVLDDVEPKVSKLTTLSKLAKIAMLALTALIFLELVTGLIQVWQQSPILFGVYSGLIGVILAWAGKVIVSEYKKLKSLKNQQNHQQTSLRLKNSMQLGEAAAFIRNLSFTSSDKQNLDEFNRLRSQEHNDAELLKLFEQTVLAEQDKKAKRIVHKYAAESALLLAVSPFALLDMALVLLRNQKMLTELAKCYGIELGYASRIKLTRSIVKNILYAGTAEVLTDIGSHLLSLELTGKLSAKLGQGLGGGLLTARLGYQAMALCRPIAFDKKTKPKLTNIHKLLLIELKNFSKNK
ncbi:TIGR01620 family protein [Parashewanella curva]|uniref:TIGR01620 family protein n=1 Tax=Parashewanella curva TaxID=2338552 RepID=A0A3L8PXG7_9GAMM|nr:TIGR01620 family protein [Parashewanella curva]RLV59323.1 TIGR01620 family protein [Parashewanella curva]